MRRLRAALEAAGYTYDGVAGLLGPTAHAALSRNETTPGLRATRDGSALATLTRLWLLQAPVTVEAAERALPGLLGPLAHLGIVQGSGDEVRALVDVRPYADEDHDWWVVSDLTPGLDGRNLRVGGDHVLGISSASTSLAQLTVRDPADRALDLGTGCGVQALHLAAHTREVVATDVNERALWMTGLNAELNGAFEDGRLEVRDGSLFEPVAGERFDLVVTNPPFVISPATGERLVYRDSGLPGDEVVQRVVTEAPGHLRPGGWCQVLANWVIEKDRPWDERLTGWVEGSGCDAWVVQREVADPAQYVELWLKDAGLHGTPEYTERYDAWLAWFEQQGVEGVGFGWLNLHRTDRGDPVLRFEEWPYEVEQPLGREVADRAGRVALERSLDDDALLAARLVVRADVRQETFGQPGAEDPEQIVLRQQRGLRRARKTDTVEAGLVGACDGDLAVGQILDALATLLDGEPSDLRREYLPVVRDLLVEGFLTDLG
ncbi:MAG TPA: methyltransferase [Nocardioidaceae bacterium]|nr:methyltransferase [Nocardioidaceae bacterium]